VILSCSRDSDNNDCPKNTYDYKVFSQRKIDTLTDTMYQRFTYKINNGNKLVFLFKHTQDICALAYDGGFTETVAFEIPVDAKSFSLKDDELKNANTYYLKSCFCANVYPRLVQQGFLEGQQAIGGNIWHVQGQITIPGDTKAISVNGSYQVE
jgi:hypothetical protein